MCNQASMAESTHSQFTPLIRLQATFFPLCLCLLIRGTACQQKEAGLWKEQQQKNNNNAVVKGKRVRREKEGKKK